MSNERSAAGHGQWTLGNPHWTQIMTFGQIGLLLAVCKFRPNAAKLASINKIAFKLDHNIPQIGPASLHVAQRFAEVGSELAQRGSKLAEVKLPPS